MEKLMINLGCGGRAHPDWVNLDYSRLTRFKVSILGRWLIRMNILSPSPPNYRDYDLRKGVPYNTKVVDYVYCSHVLEHIDRAYVQTFIAEVFRVLRPAGVFRVVVPNLEKVINDYLKALNNCRDHKDIENDAKHYDSIMLELFDQFVRTELGGEKGKQTSSRFGDYKGARQSIKHFLARLIMPNDPSKTGELHRWMYDDYSLERLLRSAGFTDIKRVCYNDSAINYFANYCLDNNPDGSEYIIDSLYLEAMKPPA